MPVMCRAFEISNDAAELGRRPAAKGTTLIYARNSGVSSNSTMGTSSNGLFLDSRFQRLTPFEDELFRRYLTISGQVGAQNASKDVMHQPV